MYYTFNISSFYFHNITCGKKLLKLQMKHDIARNQALFTSFFDPPELCSLCGEENVSTKSDGYVLCIYY